MSDAMSNNKIIYYNVKEGDTLWAIANEFNYLNIDNREMVYEIKKNNELKSSRIYPGDIIKIYVSYDY